MEACDMSDRLREAISQGRMETVSAILASRSVSLNKGRVNFLGWAVRADCNSNKIIEALVQNGADVNLPERILTGHFPLAVAISTRNVETTRQLLRLGANPNLAAANVHQLQTYAEQIAIENTPLLMAVRFDLLNLVQILVEAGADVNQADRDGYFPLLLAVEKGYADIVTYLLKRGADPWLLSPTGKTIYEVAEKEEVHEALHPRKVLTKAPLTKAPSVQAPERAVPAQSKASAWQWLCCCANVAPSVADASAETIADTDPGTNLLDAPAVTAPEEVVIPHYERAPPGPVQYGRFVMPAAPPRAPQADQVLNRSNGDDKESAACLTPAETVTCTPVKEYGAAQPAASIATAVTVPPSSTAPSVRATAATIPRRARPKATAPILSAGCADPFADDLSLPHAVAALSNNDTNGAVMNEAWSDLADATGGEQAQTIQAQARAQQQLAKTTEEQARALEQQAQALREQAETILQLRQQLADAERATVAVPHAECKEV